jgi:hypothetical protein
MTLEARTQALLDLVEADRREAVDTLAGDARARRAELLAVAHADARTRMREAFAEERTRAAERIGAARARLATRRRLHDQQHAAALLAAGLARLPDVLRSVWRDAAARARWIDTVIDTALPVLPASGWRIAHALDWAAAERDALAARLASSLAAPPEFVADAAIDAGMRVAAGGNVIDGTRAGLCADRAAIGAELLGILEEAR